LKLGLATAAAAGLAGAAVCSTYEHKSEEMGKERWAPAPGFEEHYAVSDRGRVMRVAGGVGARLGRLLTPTITAKGYHRVELRAFGQRRAFYVQRLVLGAFKGPNPDALARHLDGDRDNNHLDNLAWGSASDNFDDALEHGTINRDAEGRFVAWDDL
jgi:hypothetical protein